MKTKLQFRLLAMLSLLLAALPAQPARAAGLTVNSLADTIAVDGNCTLREAIQNANDDSATYADCTAGTGADTISFSDALGTATITLTSGPLNITDPDGLTINGGADIAVSGDDLYQVFYVNAGVPLTLDGLIVANGYCTSTMYISGGGGVYNRGTLTIANSTFSGNHSGNGGGIYNGGTLTITNSAFSDNHSGSGGDGENGSGGGIYNAGGTLTITNSTFSDNSASAELDGRGGGIYNGGTSTITNSTFSDNTAEDGGGIYNASSTLTITNSIFSGNSAGGRQEPGGGGSGGSIYNGGGTLTITNSTFSDNSSTTGGGGISNGGGTLTITNSIFSRNSASGDFSNGGGISNGGTLTIANSTFSDNSSASDGGGIYNGGPLTIANSTFSYNHSGSGGGIYNGGPLTIANSTFFDNTTEYDGGGIYNSSGPLTIANSTFSGNSASGVFSPVNHGGGIYNDGTVTLRNTIVANSASGGNCGGTITNGGNNLDDGTTCGWGSTSGSMSNTNPLLGALTGSLAYFPLNAGSPAIDTGDDKICAAWPVNNQSQNGVTRPQGEHCDIGSYELVDTTPPTVQIITRADTNPTSAASVHFTVTFSEPVTGVSTADFSLTASGITYASVAGVSGYGTTYTITVNTGFGFGTLRLDVVDNDTIRDGAGNPLGGKGMGNGNYTSGQKYTLDRDNQFRSAAAQDGWVLESSETSGKGGSLAATGNLRLGDDAANKQYRSLLYFNTAGLPDNATITKVTLKIRKASVTGTDPFTTHGPLLADIKKGTFGASPLEIGDFQATASKTNVGHFSAVSGSTGWVQLVLGAANYPYINKTGVTQFRLRFTKDDNNDHGADYVSFYAGDATTASNQPLLIIEYTLP